MSKKRTVPIFPAIFWTLLFLLAPAIATATAFSGIVNNTKEGVQADSMPLYIKNLHTPANDSTKIGRIGYPNKWQKSLTTPSNLDTIRAIVRDTINNQEDTTFTIFGVYGEELPTMSLGGQSGTIKMIYSPTDSAYAKLVTSLDTIYEKFKIGNDPYNPEIFNLAFDMTKIAPIESLLGQLATIHVRSTDGNYYGTSSKTINRNRIDADVFPDITLAQSTLRIDAFLRAITVPPESVRIGQTIQRQIIAGDSTDLARITRNVIMDRERRGINIEHFVNQVNLEPLNFQGDESLLTYSPITFACVDSGANTIVYRFAQDDSNSSNNQIIHPIFVQVYDAAAREILSPESIISQGSIVVPRGIIRNGGNVRLCSIPAIMNITGAKGNNLYGEYSDTLVLDLEPGQEQEIGFEGYHANTPGTFQTQLILDLNSLQDDSLGNNMINGTGFEVIESITPPIPQASWQRRADFLTQAIGKNVKDGGALTGIQGLGKVMAFKGNNSNDVLWYNPDDSSFFYNPLDSMIYGHRQNDPTKIDKKRIKNGSALCSDGSTAFGAKGATNEFWQYISGQGWTPRGFVPSQKKLGGGTSLVHKDGKVYILAGNQKVGYDNFIVYDTLTKTFSPLSQAPLGPNTKKWKDGSDLAVLVDRIIAMKGGDKYNYVYSYNIAADSWNITPETIPLIHPAIERKKKIVKGGALINAAGTLYATKGNSNEFWGRTSGGVWVPKDTILRLNKKSIPKGGADLTYLKDGENYGHIYLAKGNNTLEFWSYGPIADSTEEGKENSNLIVPKKEINIYMPDKSIIVPKGPELVKPVEYSKPSIRDNENLIVPTQYQNQGNGRGIIMLRKAEVYNTLGQKVQDIYTDKADMDKVKLKGLVRGVYFVKPSGENSKPGKIVVIK